MEEGLVSFLPSPWLLPLAAPLPLGASWSDGALVGIVEEDGADASMADDDPEDPGSDA